MARLHEYQGKGILANNGFRIPRGRAASVVNIKEPPPLLTQWSKDRPSVFIKLVSIRKREDVDSPVKAFSITTPARSRSARERRVAILGEEPFQRFPREVKSALLAAAPSGSP